MKNIGQQFKQRLRQQPLKVSAVIFVILGLITVGTIQHYQLKGKATSADLKAIMAKQRNEQITDVAQSSATNETNTSNDSKASQSTTEKLDKIYVEIKGSVAQPNVYQVAADARINDLVKLAGGLTKDADSRQINLAQPLQDGMSIYVPKKGEDLLVQEQTDPPVTSSAIGEAGVPNKINLNQADATQLQQVSGIGPKKAADIIDYRQKDGPFKSVDELTNVNGIGEKTLANIRDELCV
ncbi:MAG TPA: helix-hairpin-helix domain-containing protein [Lapidilactobacillus dextrinicus]|uniref:Helix-hairpin-helix domain-containing protein n=1 Tax=Lapidilactobacillus dextrinicus TaxID=51664 RepID=A0A921DWD8_9LACO|nr:helix-hairpin-helix domain-containing protein [Lapidilactobacillus dextrinicus]